MKGRNEMISKVFSSFRCLWFRFTPRVFTSGSEAMFVNTRYGRLGGEWVCSFRGPWLAPWDCDYGSAVAISVASWGDDSGQGWSQRSCQCYPSGPGWRPELESVCLKFPAGFGSLASSVGWKEPDSGRQGWVGPGWPSRAPAASHSSCSRKVGMCFPSLITSLPQDFFSFS